MTKPENWTDGPGSHVLFPSSPDEQTVYTSDDEVAAAIAELESTGEAVTHASTRAKVLELQARAAKH